MRVVDAYLLGEVGRGQDAEHPDRLALGGIIGGDPYLPVYEGETGIDLIALTTQKVVQYPVPFATYASSIGADANPRLTGRPVRRSMFFSITYVGGTMDQAKWAGERLRLKLQRHRPVIDGYTCWPILHNAEESRRIRHDDNVMRPDGSPLYYGIDDFAVSIMFTQTGVPLP